MPLGVDPDVRQNRSVEPAHIEPRDIWLDQGVGRGKVKWYRVKPEKFVVLSSGWSIQPRLNRGLGLRPLLDRSGRIGGLQADRNRRPKIDYRVR